MSEADSLSRLQGLQADLVAFTESRLPNFERLCSELEASIEEFRKLLDHKTKSEKSRKELENDTVTIGDQSYSLNAEFKQEVIQIADELDVDELVAAQLLLQAHDNDRGDDRPASFAAILRYHGRNEALLESLRLILQAVSDEDSEFEGRDTLNQVVQAVLQQDPDKPAPRSIFWQKAFSDASHIERWLNRLRDRIISASVIGQSQHALAIDALTFQRESLLRQHESIAAILCLLIKMGHTAMEDYRALMTRLATLETFDEMIVHYIPSLMAFAFAIGSPHGPNTLREARSLDLVFADTTSTTRWKLRDFQACANVFWLAEYSARYMEEVPASPLQGVNLEKEADSRSDRVLASLRDGAFQTLLLLYYKIRPQLWHDPAKSGLLSFLIGETRPERTVSLTFSAYFDELLSLHTQMFIDALITNLPDTIRRLKYEEDDDRRNAGASMSIAEQQQSLHLERFMLLISYAFSGSAIASLQTFWADLDGNMYGFLQWASKRQSTPRAAAFCEMFRAIAESEECADAAHRLLMDDSSGVSSAKLRRGVTLNWSQVFTELAFYADRLRESPALLTNSQDPSAAANTEPESALMLECYLRLTSHLARSSKEARDFLLAHPEFRIHEVLFDLCRSPIESRFKACAYQTLSALLSAKPMEVSYGMWEALDAWVCGASQRKGTTGQIGSGSTQSDGAIVSRLQPIALAFEESNAFVRFLQSLVEVPADQQALNDALPYPEQLGTSYRMSGIDQYVDFVMGSVMAQTLPTVEDEDYRWELRCACLDFIRVSLSSFNEHLVIFANTTSVNVDAAIATTDLQTYARLHPFARTMEWLFNDAVIDQLFASSHEDPDTLAALPADSPRVTAVARAIQIIDLTLRLQATYLDIVRPIVKTKSAVRSRNVANPTLASFEDAILANLQIVVDLGLYCSTAFEHLTLLSLELLQRLAASRKLATSSARDGTSHTGRLVIALQQSDDARRIAAAVRSPLELDARELEGGDEAPGQKIKIAVMELLDASLETSNSKPVLAHCLLGFECRDNSIGVAPESPFSQGTSLFHAIARLYAETAALDFSSPPATVTHLRSKATQVLQKLLRSTLTSDIVRAELRESGFIEAVAIALQSVTSQIGEVADEVEFLLSPPALLLQDMLAERAAYFEYQGLELRTAAASGSASLQDKVRSSLFGMTRMATGEEVRHADIFDLFDYFELDMSPLLSPPPLSHMRELDFSTCENGIQGQTATYDLRLVNELLLLRAAELRSRGELNDEQREQECIQEMDLVLAFCQATNIGRGIKAAQKSTTASWTQLMTIMLTCAGIEDSSKPAFVLRALQTALPKIEYGLDHDWLEVLPLMRLINALVNTSSAHTATGQASAPIDQLTAAMRTSLNCVTSSMDSLDLRECAYKIMTRVLITEDAGLERAARKSVETLGERLLDIMAEDAFSSTAGARTSAMAALQSLVELFSAQRKPFLVRSLTKLNFIQILVDNIRNVPMIFSEQRSKSEIQATIAWISSSLALLLQIASDNEGTSAVLDAGLFGAIRDSGLFTADPEVGDDSHEALERFYGLLGGVLRIIATVLTVKGTKNEVVMGAARAFLSDSRACFLAVLKATKRATGLTEKTKIALAEVLDGFQIIVWTSGWLEIGENKPAARKGTLTFT